MPDLEAPPRQPEDSKIGADTLANATVSREQIAADALTGRIDYHREKELAEIRTMKAHATMNQAAAFLMVWVLLWFAIAIAAAGIKTAQYIHTTWTPSFLP